MKHTWRELSNRFDALTRRERAIVALALLFVSAWAGYLWLIDPAWQRRAVALKLSSQASRDMAGIEAQLAVLQGQVKDPDVAQRAALSELRARTGVVDAKLAGLQGTMVAAERMPSFLQALLARHRNLELLALHTLPPTALLEHGEHKTTDAKRPPGPEGAANIYKHGVEIRIAGTYNDLLTYLNEIERMPSRVIWNRIALSVDQYPRSVLTLTVYTLSLDKRWLVL